jgi:hypothetical protein
MRNEKELTPSAEGRTKRPEQARDFLLEQMPKKSVCAEIGVYRGDFAARILTIVRPLKLHLVDPWKYEASATYQESLYGGERGASQANLDAIYDGLLRRFQAPIAAGTISVHRAASSDACLAFPDSYFDWIYIDGNHLYEFVKQDLELYCPKVKRGGYITGDDYGADEGHWWHGGVKKAVDEFVRNRLVELLETRNRQFCIRKM